MVRIQKGSVPVETDTAKTFMQLSLKMITIRLSQISELKFAPCSQDVNDF